MKGGEGEFTGLDGGLVFSHGEKGGAAETRVRSGAWTAAVGEKHGETYISGFDGPYLNAEAASATIAGGINRGVRTSLSMGIRLGVMILFLFLV